MNSYTNEITIKTSPQKLFEAITTEKGLKSWWTTKAKVYSAIGGIATFYFGKKTYVVMKIAKLTEQKEVMWKCVEQYFKVAGSQKTDEWVGTEVKFKIIDNPDKTTTLLFAHEGLTQKLSCYAVCSKGWDSYLKSLKQYLETGKGKPYKNL